MIHYRPFADPAKEIRLLEVQPSKIRDSPLIARLVYRNFENTAYQALSYFWGQQVDNRVDIEIYYEESKVNHDSPVNSTQITIGQNLGSALRELRSPGEVLTIWADAICINQTDLVERSFQVQVMHSIYNCAAKVIAWLGTAGEHTDAALDTISSIGKDFENRSIQKFRLRKGESNFGADAYLALASLWRTDEPVDDSGGSVTLFLNSYVDRMTTDTENKATSAGIRELLGRQYWLRIWTFQEYYAASEVEVRCGSRSVPFDSLFLTIILLDTHNRIEARETRKLGYISKNQKCRDVIRIHEFSSLVHFWILRNDRLDKLGLVFLLNYSRRSKPGTKPQASDDRDLIYALLGNAKDSLGIVPDYLKAPKTAFVDASMALIANEGHSLHLLLENHQNDGIYMDDLPSWALDPTATVSDLDIGHFPRSSNLQAKSPRVRFRTDSNSETSHLIWPRMCIQGASISYVVGATDSLASFRLKRHNHGHTYPCWMTNGLCGWLPHMRNLCSDIGASQSEDLRLEEKILEIFKYCAWKQDDQCVTTREIRMLLSIFAPLTREDVEFTKNLTDPELAKEWKTDAWDNVVRDFLALAGEVSARIVFLNNGHVGLTDRDVVSGDKVVFLWGTEHPTILRRPRADAREAYRRLGTILIPGAMDDIFVGALQEETFELC